eukprot:jgi/Mesvir1/23696/Mv18648-RA.1
MQGHHVASYVLPPLSRPKRSAPQCKALDGLSSDVSQSGSRASRRHGARPEAGDPSSMEDNGPVVSPDVARLIALQSCWGVLGGILQSVVSDAMKPTFMQVASFLTDKYAEDRRLLYTPPTDHSRPDSSQFSSGSQPTSYQPDNDLTSQSAEAPGDLGHPAGAGHLPTALLFGVSASGIGELARYFRRSVSRVCVLGPDTLGPGSGGMARALSSLVSQLILGHEDGEGDGNNDDKDDAVDAARSSSQSYDMAALHAWYTSPSCPPEARSQPLVVVVHPGEACDPSALEHLASALLEWRPLLPLSLLLSLATSADALTRLLSPATLAPRLYMKRFDPPDERALLDTTVARWLLACTMPPTPLENDYLQGGNRGGWPSTAGLCSGRGGGESHRTAGGHGGATPSQVPPPFFLGHAALSFLYRHVAAFELSPAALERGIKVALTLHALTAPCGVLVDPRAWAGDDEASVEASLGAALRGMLGGAHSGDAGTLGGDAGTLGGDGSLRVSPVVSCDQATRAREEKETLKAEPSAAPLTAGVATREANQSAGGKGTHVRVDVHAAVPPLPASTTAGGAATDPPQPPGGPPAVLPLLPADAHGPAVRQLVAARERVSAWSVALLLLHKGLRLCCTHRDALLAGGLSSSSITTAGGGGSLFNIGGTGMGGHREGGAHPGRDSATVAGIIDASLCQLHVDASSPQYLMAHGKGLRTVGVVARALALAAPGEADRLLEGWRALAGRCWGGAAREDIISTVDKIGSTLRMAREVPGAGAMAATPSSRVLAATTGAGVRQDPGGEVAGLVTSASAQGEMNFADANHNATVSSVPAVDVDRDTRASGHGNVDGSAQGDCAGAAPPPRQPPMVNGKRQRRRAALLAHIPAAEREVALGLAPALRPPATAAAAKGNLGRAIGSSSVPPSLQARRRREAAVVDIERLLFALLIRHLAPPEFDRECGAAALCFSSVDALRGALHLEHRAFVLASVEGGGSAGRGREIGSRGVNSATDAPSISASNGAGGAASKGGVDGDGGNVHADGGPAGPGKAGVDAGIRKGDAGHAAEEGERVRVSKDGALMRAAVTLHALMREHGAASISVADLFAQFCLAWGHRDYFDQAAPGGSEGDGAGDKGEGGADAGAMLQEPAVAGAAGGNNNKRKRRQGDADSVPQAGSVLCSMLSGTQGKGLQGDAADVARPPRLRKGVFQQQRIERYLVANKRRKAGAQRGGGAASEGRPAAPKMTPAQKAKMQRCFEQGLADLEIMGLVGAGRGRSASGGGAFVKSLVV